MTEHCFPMVSPVSVSIQGTPLCGRNVFCCGGRQRWQQLSGRDKKTT